MLLLAAPAGWAAGPYEGTWFTCVFEMAGRRNPWSVQDLQYRDGQLTVFSEWGTAYTFSGTARKEGKELVIRGCASYRGETVLGCDEANPPVAERLKLPLSRKAPANLDRALRRGDSIFIRDRAHYEKLIARCEELIDAEEARKEGR